MSKNYRSWDEYQKESLKDPEEAVAYLNAALEDDDEPELLLLALRNVADAYGFSEMSRNTGLNRAGLYRMLSERGNPEYSSLKTILDTIGVQLRFELKKRP